jgi:hypothetical protein
MLCNERYTGRVTWNQSKWVRVPGRKSRRRVPRPESEWVTQSAPALAIVSPEQWAAVQDRFRRVHATARGRPAGTGRHVYLISGLLRCGVCGSSMTVVGRKQKAGVSYARFGCTAHSSRFHDLRECTLCFGKESESYTRRCVASQAGSTRARGAVRVGLQAAVSSAAVQGCSTRHDVRAFARLRTPHRET